MPIIDLNKYAGHYVEDANSYLGKKWVRDYSKENIGFFPKAQFYKELKFRKASVTFHCSGCGKEHSRGMRCLGDSYSRICHNCADTFYTNALVELEKIKQTLLNGKEELKTNKIKWDKEAIVGALSDKKD